MTELEDALRARLHARLDDVDVPPTLAAGVPGRAAAVRRRRLATGALGSVAVLVLLGGGLAATDALRRDRATLQIPANEGERGDALLTRTQRYAEQFAAGDFESVRRDMTPAARKALTVRVLRGVWRGAFPSTADITTGHGRRSKTQDDDVAAVEVRSGGLTAVLRVVFTPGGDVTGMLLTARDQRAFADDPLVRRANEVVRQLAGNDYAGVRRDFDATMRSGLSESKLRLGWEQMLAQYGAFERADGVLNRLAGEHQVVDVVCEFAEGTMKVRITFDAEDRIAGLFILRLDA